MPAIVPVAAGFGAGVFAGLALSVAWWPLAPAAALGAALALGRWPRIAAALVAAVAGGCWGWAAAAEGARGCAARWRDGARVAVVVEAWDVVEAGGRSRVRVVAPASCRASVTASWPEGVAPPRGVAAVEGAWYGGTPRGPSWWPRRPEAGGRLVVARVRPLGAPASWRGRLRLAAERRLVTLFGWPRFPLAGALTLGSADQLDPGLRRRFAAAGLAHLLAISGLHVAILAAALIAALGALGVAPGAARAASVPAVAAYVWVLGMPPPALRAVALLAVWEAARLRQRPPVRAAVLAVTALAVMAVDPWAVAQVGPWLSFAGAWGAAEGARWWDALPWRARLREAPLFPLGRAGAVSAGASLATAPVSALAFGTVTAASVATNVVAIPLVGVLVPLLAVALAATVVPGSLAAVAAAGAGLLMDGLERVAAAGADLPLGSVTVLERGRVAAALGAGLWLCRRIALPRRRASYRGIARWRAATALAALGAAAAWWRAIPEGTSGFRPGWLTVDFLAVGHGDAAVVRTPAGRWLLIDGGPRLRGRDAGAAVVAPYLRRAGADRLAVVVASHGDADHLGGLPSVLRAVSAELALEPGEPLGTALYREWLGALRRAGARWHPARTGDVVELDGVRLRVLHPDSAWLARGRPANDNSVVLRLEYGGFAALFPGDAGLDVEAALGDAGGPVTALKVGHHGSRSGTGPSWLAALAPRICLVSVGANPYGLPDADVLGALADAGCATYRTDADGPVRITTDGRTARVAARGREDAIPLTPRGVP